MKRIAILYVIVLMMFFMPKNIISADSINSIVAINVQRYNNDIDIVTIGGKDFYINSNHHFISSLVYAITISSFDSISSDAIIINENYYKYDIFKDNENITLVFYEFKDENDGTEIVLDLTKEEVYDIIDKVEEAHGVGVKD